MRLFPIILIVLGVVMLLTNLGVLPANWGRQWWPVLLIVIGIAALLRPPSMPHRRRREQDAGPESKT
jgi:LiaI-LiaF-like transmembrane region